MASSSSAAISRANKCSREGKSSSHSFQGKHLTNQTKRIFMDMVEYFKNEAKKSKGRPNVIDKVIKATSKTDCITKTIHELAFSGLSQTTIKNVKQEFEKGGGDFDSPMYKKSCFRIDADNFDQEALRRKIYSLYEKRENLSLNKILACHNARRIFYLFEILTC